MSASSSSTVTIRVTSRRAPIPILHDKKHPTGKAGIQAKVVVASTQLYMNDSTAYPGHVALDVLKEGTQFFAAEPALEDHVQLYEAKSSTMTNERITFVFGRAQLGAQKSSFGWINKDLLG